MTGVQTCALPIFDLFVYDLGVVSLAVAGILILGGTGLGITFQIVLQRMFDD